jgi:hypothetical protein
MSDAAKKLIRSTLCAVPENRPSLEKIYQSPFFAEHLIPRSLPEQALNAPPRSPLKYLSRNTTTPSPSQHSSTTPPAPLLSKENSQLLMGIKAMNFKSNLAASSLLFNENKDPQLSASHVTAAAFNSDTVMLSSQPLSSYMMNGTTTSSVALTGSNTTSHVLHTSPPKMQNHSTRPPLHEFKNYAAAAASPADPSKSTQLMEKREGKNFFFFFTKSPTNNY